jgi:hypothetical protein
MTALLERVVPVDEITAQARQARPGRAVLTVIAAVFFGIGWLAGRMVFALAWCAVAVKVGWQEGRGNAVSRGAA